MEQGARRGDEGPDAESAAAAVAAPGGGATPERTGLNYARAWRVAAYALLAAAAVLLYLNRPEAAFFSAALGVSAWFLNVRSDIKRKHDLVKDGARNWRPRSDVRDYEE